MFIEGRRNICGDWPRNQLYRVKRILRPRKHGAGVDFTTDNLQSTIRMYHVCAPPYVSNYSSHFAYKDIKYLQIFWLAREGYLPICLVTSRGSTRVVVSLMRPATLLLSQIWSSWAGLLVNWNNMANQTMLYILLWMKHIPHHDIDAAREWSDQCLQPPWASLNTTPLLTTAHHCSSPLNTTPLLSSDCSSADDDHREGQDDNVSKIFCSQSPQSGITLILIFCDPPHYDHDHLSHWSPLNIFPYRAPPCICFLLQKAITQTISLSCYIIIIHIKILHSFVWKISSPCYEYFDLCNSSGSKALQLYKMVWSYSGAKI